MELCVKDEINIIKITNMKINLILSYFYLPLFLLFALSISSTATAQPTKIEGLVASYKFDNDKDGWVEDSAGEDHGESTNVTYVDGVVGKAAKFNGTDSKIIIANREDAQDSPISNLSIGTFSCWVKFENVGGQVLPILYLGKSDSTMPTRSMIFEIGHDRGDEANRRLYFTTLYAQQNNFCVDSGMNLQEGVWYHYVAVVSKEGSTIYLNGVEITTRRYNLGSTESCSVFFSDVPNKELLSIGYGRYSQEEPFFSFNGLIDEVEIYNRALSPSEVQELFMVGGLEMGDPALGYIDAQSMVEKSPVQHGKMKQGSRMKQSGKTKRNSNMRQNKM